ncbi:tubulin polyglutamylase complex subunit 2-like [Folsomia candida]|uniref:tubulin polyglutamylase complex subunit 2-like n=1 Tax=Folsomia candida TaxID=158441 RepID=UPI001604C7F6|nr:tubulin polyglutamylase complex subunit 2-like [Folsomia candida]
MGDEGEPELPNPLTEAKQGSSRITPAIQFSQEEQTYHKHLTLGIEDKLQKNRMIKDINLTIRKPTEKPTISGWERKHGVLPTDLKDYYLSTNGFKLTWSLEHAGDNLKIGEMNINPINQLVALESLDPVDAGGDGRRMSGNTTNKFFDIKRSNGKLKLSGNFSQLEVPHRKINPGGNSEEIGDINNKFSIYFSELRQTMEANSQSKSQKEVGLFLAPNDKAFILDQSKYGWVCLIYPAARNKTILLPPNSPRSVTEPSQQVEPNVEIWFLDNSLTWHYLAPTFSHYYRMLLFHLGVPQWQYRFTPYGLSSWAEQLFWIIVPHLLTPLKPLKINTSSDLWSSDVPSEAATPNPTPNVLSSVMFRRKKRDKVEGV